MESLRFPLRADMLYIATFYSHFGAMRFKKMCDERQVPARLMPVPRNLSSSCGTCVRYESDDACPVGIWTEEVEQAAEVQSEGYRVVYKAKNS